MTAAILIVVLGIGPMPPVAPRPIPKAATVTQWFGDIDDNPQTGYGRGFEVMVSGGKCWSTAWAATGGPWGPEMDCSWTTGPRVLGWQETYANGELQATTAVRMTLTVRQSADLDSDGDVDLRDWARGASAKIAERMTGP